VIRWLRRFTQFNRKLPPCDRQIGRHQIASNSNLSSQSLLRSSPLLWSGVHAFSRVFPPICRQKLPWMSHFGPILFFRPDLDMKVQRLTSGQPLPSLYFHSDTIKGCPETAPSPALIFSFFLSARIPFGHFFTSFFYSISELPSSLKRWRSFLSHVCALSLPCVVYASWNLIVVVSSL